MSKHSRPILYRRKHEGPLLMSILGWIATLPAGWCYVGVYALGALAGILLGLLIKLIL